MEHRWSASVVGVHRAFLRGRRAKKEGGVVLEGLISRVFSLFLEKSL